MLKLEKLGNGRRRIRGRFEEFLGPLLDHFHCTFNYTMLQKLSVLIP